MILLFNKGFPKSGKFFILKLVYRKIDTDHNRRSQVVMRAGAFNAADKRMSLSS